MKEMQIVYQGQHQSLNLYHILYSGYRNNRIRMLLKMNLFKLAP